MKKILVPIDCSNASRQTSEYAVSFAKMLNADIQLLHVYMEPTTGVEGPTPWTVTASDLRIQNETQLNKEIDFLENKYSIKISGDVQPGFTGDTIKDVATKMEADLIILGMKAEKRRGPLGSTVTKMIRKSNIPVMVVPETTIFKPLEHIVLAVDFSSMASGSCFDPLFRMLNKIDASLIVLHVDKKGADLKVYEVAEKLQLGRVLSKTNYLYERIESDNVEEGIKNFVEGHPVDLLVMVAHHHNIFERLFGSVHTQPLSFELKIPLFVLKD